MTFSLPVVANTYQWLLPKGESSDQKAEVRRHFTLAQGLRKGAIPDRKPFVCWGFVK